ncbi:hypothetical protein C8R44DRAFT_749056 [Mycena epipterygia]|nr:hypothetical protein C8R44DRAFT_749056 [Mycena epipterygia]
MWWNIVRPSLGPLAPASGLDSPFPVKRASSFASAFGADIAIPVVFVPWRVLPRLAQRMRRPRRLLEGIGLVACPSPAALSSTSATLGCPALAQTMYNWRRRCAPTTRHSLLLINMDGAFDKDESLARIFAAKAAGKGLVSGNFAIGYYAEAGAHGNTDARECSRSPRRSFSGAVHVDNPAYTLHSMAANTWRTDDVANKMFSSSSSPDILLPASQRKSAERKRNQFPEYNDSQFRAQGVIQRSSSCARHHSERRRIGGSELQQPDSLQLGRACSRKVESWRRYQTRWSVASERKWNTYSEDVDDAPPNLGRVGE